MPDPTSISAQLRDAIRASGRSFYSIGYESRIDPAIVSRFVRGKRGLTTRSLDAIAGALGLQLVAIGPAVSLRNNERSVKRSPEEQAIALP